MLHEAALRPTVRPEHRLFLIRTGVHQRGALVECEKDVRPELVLNLHRYLGREPMQGPVEVRGERDAVVVDLGEPALACGDNVVVFQPCGTHGEHLLEARPQAQDLEAAAVGEGRTGQFMNAPSPPAASTMSGPGCR